MLVVVGGALSHAPVSGVGPPESWAGRAVVAVGLGILYDAAIGLFIVRVPGDVQEQ